jgi:subtilase family serine protease
LSVDYPGSDAAITAAGGTTLPGKQEYCLNAACTPPYYVVDLKHEQVWGWDYLDGLCAASGTPSPIDCGTYLVGGGGGVSIEFEKPPYQLFVTGTQLSQPGQVYEADKQLATEAGVVSLYYALPAHYAGRNVPDVSFNADPQTGYVIYYTSEPSGVFGKDSAGGTSFVAPQLNGVAALLGDAINGRIGLFNYPLYASALWSRFAAHSATTVHPIAYGDNWFYRGSDGYNPAAGLGTLDVANFARFLGCVEF